MTAAKLIELEEHGGDQTVLLPAEFRLPGKRARVSRVGNGILLEPELANSKDILTEIDRLIQSRLLKEGRSPAKQIGNTIASSSVRKRMTDAEIDAMFAEIDRHAQGTFMEEGRQQPPMPPDDDLPSFE
jgi:virulence-associated protein VagC